MTRFAARTSLATVATVAIGMLAATSLQAATVIINGGRHYKGYMGVFAPGNAFNITLGGTNTGGTAYTTVNGGTIVRDGTNSGGILRNAAAWQLNVNLDGSSTETKLNALVLDAPLALGADNRQFGNDNFNQNGFASNPVTPAPNTPNPFSGPQNIVAITGPGQFINPATGATLTRAQSLMLGGLYNYLGTLTTPAMLGNAQVYPGYTQPPQFFDINYKITATQIAVWDVLGFTVALNGSSNLRTGGVNDRNILDVNGVNLVNEAQTYALAHPAFAGIIKGTNGNPSLVVLAQPVPEPASWAMLIAGFGLTGAAMRRRVARAARA